MLDGDRLALNLFAQAYARMELQLPSREDYTQMIDPEDFVPAAPPVLIRRAFPAFYKHGTLPEIGGTLEQDEQIMDGLNQMLVLIEWWKIELERPALPIGETIPDINEV